MNIVVKSALASAALAFAYACANPIEIEEDVQVVNPSAFGDAGPLGGAGDDVGQGGASPGGAAAGVGGAVPGGSGAGGGGAGITGMPVGLSGGGGLPGGAGTGGTGGSVAGTGGTSVGAGGTAAGAGGAGGTGGAAAGTGGAAAGTGGSGTAAEFDPSSCDFTDTTGCDTLDCQASCPTNDGNSCLNRCLAVVQCVSDNVADNPNAPCVSADDPLCGARDAGQARACTTVVEPAGGPNPNPPSGTQAPQPSFVARQFVECICSVPRP